MKTNHKCIQSVPGVVSTAGFNYRANYESDMSYAHRSYLQWFSTLNKLERKEVHCSFIETGTVTDA